MFAFCLHERTLAGLMDTLDLQCKRAIERGFGSLALESMILKARYWHTAGDHELAIDQVLRILSQAHPDGYITSIVKEACLPALIESVAQRLSLQQKKPDPGDPFENYLRDVLDAARMRVRNNPVIPWGSIGRRVYGSGRTTDRARIGDFTSGSPWCEPKRYFFGALYYPQYHEDPLEKHLWKVRSPQTLGSCDTGLPKEALVNREWACFFPRYKGLFSPRFRIQISIRSRSPRPSPCGGDEFNYPRTQIMLYRNYSFPVHKHIIATFPQEEWFSMPSGSVPELI